jgi:hypothetical protein
MKLTVSIVKLLLSATLLLLPVAGQQRPLLTEDIDITPEGSFEISAGVDFLQNVKYPLSGIKADVTRVGDVNVSIGLSKNVEFQVQGTLQNFAAINSVQNPTPIPLNIGPNSTNDIGDFTVSTKVKVLNETKNLPGVGIKFSVQLPNSDQARGIGTNQINVFGLVLMQKGFGRKNGKKPRLTLLGNLGLGIMPAPLERFTQNDVLLYGFGGIVRVNDRINLVSEINGRANTRSGAAPLGTESISQFRVGTQIKASGLRFDTAAIFGLTKNSPRTGLTFGVTYQSPTIFTPAQ